VRVSRSDDGLSWAASGRLGELTMRGEYTGLPVSLAEDGTGCLVALWADAGEVGQARSTDGGRTWSAAGTVASGDPALVEVSRAVRAPDGSLLVLVSRAPGPEVQVYRSTDCGAGWQVSVL
jgi:hypothetical protein